MNKLDIILLIPIGLGFIFGLFKGLIKEITSLAAIVLGIFGAKLLSPIVSGFLVSWFHFSQKMALSLSYLVLFVAIALGLMLLAKSLEKIFDSMSLGGLNKFFGGIFGALKNALIVSVLLIVFNAIDSRVSIISPATKNNSIAYQPLMKLAPKLWEETQKDRQPNHKKNDEEKQNYTK